MDTSKDHLSVCPNSVLKVWSTAKAAGGNPDRGGETIFPPGQTPKTGAQLINLPLIERNGEQLVMWVRNLLIAEIATRDDQFDDV